MVKTQLEMDDDKILRRIKTSTRMMWRVVWVLTSGFALVFAVITTASFTGHAALVTSVAAQIVTAAVVVALFVYALVMMSKYYVSPIDADSPRLVRRRIDVYQRRWRWVILLNIFTTLAFVVNVPGSFSVLRGAHQSLLMLIGACAAGFMIMMAFILSAGPGMQGMAQPGARALLNDEFASALRARTMRFGYILVMLLIGAAYLVALWQPNLAPAALAWALYAGFAVPALYYVIADWRASRGGEG